MRFGTLDVARVLVRGEGGPACQSSASYRTVCVSLRSTLTRRLSYVTCSLTPARHLSLLFPVLFYCPSATVNILILGDLAEGCAPYDNAGATPACLRDPTGPGVAWWSMMNGNVGYDEQPPIKTSPSSTPVTTSSASSTSPVTSQSGPLHIPAKRLGYECVEGSGVIRHSHPGHWNYATPGEYGEYNSQPTYYNLPDNRDRKSGLFWNPASQEYKYTTTVTPGTSTDPAVSTCHQSFSNSWCNYTPYSSRHHVEPGYLPTTDDRRAMVEGAAAGFGHDFRNYPPPDPVASTPYPPPGM